MNLCEDTQNLLPLRQLIEGNLDNFIPLLQRDFHRGSHTDSLPGTGFLLFMKRFDTPIKKKLTETRKFTRAYLSETSFN